MILLSGELGLITACQTPESDSQIALDKFIGHLRKNFDDVHDVSMRFHHQDPSLGGFLRFRMRWLHGRLEEAEVVENETGCVEEGVAFIEFFKQWEIPEIYGPVTFEAPLRIKLVGSDDPGFPVSAILTGEVRESRGNPVVGAKINLMPREEQGSGLIKAANPLFLGLFCINLSWQSYIDSSRRLPSQHLLEPLLAEWFPGVLLQK
jgi:hypothetical protein